jgi:hypothetical protein
MTLEDYSGPVDLACIVIGIGLIIVVTLFYLEILISGIFLLIFGIGAIIAGLLRIIISVYSLRNSF